MTIDTPTTRAGSREPLLEVRDLEMHFPITRGVLNRTVGHVRAVDGVSFVVEEGETLGLVGESGCGKTTLGRSLLRVHRPTAGSILYRGADGELVDLAQLSPGRLKPYRRQIRMVFQDPHSSLNPRFPVRDIVAEPLRVNRLASGRELDERVAHLLRQVGLRPETMHRYPHAFSGGERQRIGIARALATGPRLVVADEAVSALDVSVQAQILNLLRRLQAELGLTYVFVSHDLSVVEHISDRVAVMYVGKIVESAPTARLFERPLHPYTEALLSAVPKPDPRLRGRGGRIRLPGEVADPAQPPPGCPFHPRCPYARERCAHDVPALREIAAGRWAACHFAEELELRGVAETAGGR
jgi:peptide/nickel transport system ATP-binding protein